MQIANVRFESTEKFLKATRGMISLCYALGCSVGANADNTQRPHLLRDLAVRLRIPAIGVDHELWSNGSNNYLHEYGNKVIVYPKVAWRGLRRKISWIKRPCGNNHLRAWRVYFTGSRIPPWLRM